jgi:hypothetical protein
MPPVRKFPEYVLDMIGGLLRAIPNAIASLFKRSGS